MILATTRLACSPVLRVLTCAGVAFSAPVWSQSQFQHNFTAPSGLEYDSNPELTPDEPGSVYRLRVSPSYTLLRKSGSDELKLQLGALVEQSSDTALSRHRRDGRAELGWRRESEAMVIDLRAKYEQIAARAALLEETGQLSEDGTRTTQSLGVAVGRELDARQNLLAALEVKWNRYDFGRTPDDRITSANLEWSRAWAQGQDWFVAGTTAQYSPDAASVPPQPNAGTSPGQQALIQNAQQHGVMLGYRSKPPGSAWEWSVRAGVARFSGPFRDTTPQGEFKLAYEGQRWTAAALVARMPVANNLSGAFSPNTQVRLRTDYRLTEFTRLVLDLTDNRTQLNPSSPTDTSRQLGLQLTTELSARWSVSTQLRHIQVNRRSAVEPARASSRSAAVVFTYLHPDF